MKANMQYAHQYFMFYDNQSTIQDHIFDKCLGICYKIRIKLHNINSSSMNVNEFHLSI